MHPPKSSLSAILLAALLLLILTSHQHYCIIDAVHGFARLELPHQQLHHLCTRQKLSPRCGNHDNIMLFQTTSSTITPMQIIEDFKTENDHVVLLPIRDDQFRVDCVNTSSTGTNDVTSAARGAEEDSVPSTWSHALQRFFIREPGPPLVVLSISGFIFARIQSPVPFSIAEVSILASSILVWWVQEYFFHRILLHSPFQWIGKSIHQTHHEKNYFHISIDPPALLLGWLFTAHFMLRSVLPWHYCLSATVGYALAGLVYEWSHYIVHTKVRPPPVATSGTTPSFFLTETLSRLFSQMRDNHMRHHLVDDRYWYAFSVPAMDDLFQTNPNVKEVRRLQGHMK